MQMFIGVFAPNGTIEAVEGSEEQARFVAENLSPDPKRPNRTLGHVWVIAGNPADVIERLLKHVAKEKYGIDLEAEANGAD